MQLNHITVLDRAGLHTGVWAPPPSQQPRKVAAGQYDLSSIMRAAWVDYRAAERKGWTKSGFDRARWAYCLGVAWMLARVKVEKARKDAELAARLAVILASPPPAPLTGRAAEITAELLALQTSDAWSVSVAERESTLKAELELLRA